MSNRKSGTYIVQQMLDPPLSDFLSEQNSHSYFENVQFGVMTLHAMHDTDTKILFNRSIISFCSHKFLAFYLYL